MGWRRRHGSLGGLLLPCRYSESDARMLAHPARLDPLLDPFVGLRMRNIAVLPPIKSSVQMALMNLTAFHEIDTQDLIASARSLPGGTKVHVPDRVRAIVLLLGTRSLD
jgi:hypothetical protein